LKDIPDERTFAVCRALPQFIPVQTVPEALRRPGSPFRKQRPLMEVQEIFGAHRHRRETVETVVIEQKQAGLQVLEIHLIAHENDLRIGQKVVA